MELKRNEHATYGDRRVHGKLSNKRKEKREIFSGSLTFQQKLSLKWKNVFIQKSQSFLLHMKIIFSYRNESERDTQRREITETDGLVDGGGGSDDERFILR